METPLKRRRPLHGPCFALTHEYIEKVVYEEIFYLMQECNFSFSEAYNLPIKLRSWFVSRTLTYNQTEPEE